MGVHAAILRSAGYSPKTWKVHCMRIHALRTRAQPLHLCSGEETSADVAAVVLAVWLSVYFGNR